MDTVRYSIFVIFILRLVEVLLSIEAPEARLNRATVSFDELVLLYSMIVFCSPIFGQKGIPSDLTYNNTVF